MSYQQAGIQNYSNFNKRMQNQGYLYLKDLLNLSKHSIMIDYIARPLYKDRIKPFIPSAGADLQSVPL